MQSWPSRRNFPSSLPEVYKSYAFFEKSIFFSSKWSYGHEEGSDYNLTEEFLMEGRKFFPQCEKR